MYRSWWELLRPYVMIAPAMVGIGVFVAYPVFYLIYLSLFDYNLMNKAKSKFVGIDNYAEIFTRGDFYKSLSNTTVYTISVVALTIFISLVVALWLKRNTRMNRFVQAGIFTPHIVSIVSISLVWLWMMEPNQGLLNYLLKSLGMPGLPWLQSSDTALMSVTIVSVWQNIGYLALIIIAALKGISPTIYEAAALDNASRLTVFRKLTIPLISPQLFFILVVMTIGSFKVFETVQVMTGGGPNDATSTLVYYIYKFRTTNVGYASATGVVLMGIIGLLTFVYFRILAKKVHYQ